MIELANQALEDNKGEIVFVNGSNRRMIDLNHRIRYVNTKEFGIEKMNEFYGFLSGMIAKLRHRPNLYRQSAGSGQR